MLDVKKLVMLRTVASEGSIAAAGRALNYTRSAVSQQLTALEADAGAPLVNRSGNKITLTPTGQALVEHAERILVELRAAETMLAGDGAVTGLLRVGVPLREGPRIMSRALSEARRRFPDLEIRLAAITDEDGADQVHRDRIDLAIISRYGSAHPRTAPTLGLREWVLSHDPLRLCVPADHPLAARRSCTMQELRGEPWIMCTDTDFGRLTTSLCLAAGFEPRPAATVNDVGTALGLAEIGWGVTIAPLFTPATNEAAIVRLAIDGVETVRHSVLIARDGEQFSPPIAAAVAAVRTISASLPQTEAPPG
ncbi:LysR family transcriptional regulator, partial [Actinospica sp.]|uniref:LysR family transcriptional regulator n=1 Tax=Actinospica sp. TaxID=1872142 RepID=UPI002B54DB55